MSFLPLLVSLSIRRLLTYFRLPRSTGSGPAAAVSLCVFLLFFVSTTTYFSSLDSFAFFQRAPNRCWELGDEIGTFAMNLLFGRSFSIYSRCVWYQPQTMTTFIRLLWVFFFLFLCSLETSPRSVMPHLVIEGIADCLANCVNILVTEFLGGRHRVFLVYLVTSIFLGNSTRRKRERKRKGRSRYFFFWRYKTIGSISVANLLD